MNDLVTIYELFKAFGDSHGMINEFKLIGSLEDLQNIEVSHRGMYVNLDSANVSRSGNSPIYDVTFNVIVIDKVPLYDELALMNSNQENLFVMGQLQDYFGQNLHQLSNQSLIKTLLGQNLPISNHSLIKTLLGQTTP